MTLAAMIASIDTKSYHSRTREEIIEAINSAARRVYAWVIKEAPGKHFLKWDTSLTLRPGQADYELPADCKMIARVRELDPGTGKWRTVHSTDLLDVGRMQEEFSSLFAYDEEESTYKFYGPFQKDDGKYYIQIAPDPDKARSLEIVYSAAFVEIVADSDPLYIPEEGLDVVKDLALAECLQHNDDALGDSIEQRAMRKLTEYLTVERGRQGQDTLKQEAYL